MPRHDLDTPIRLPLLDSLMDDDPESGADPPTSPRALHKRYRGSVRRDLQNLLNSRQRCRSWSKDLEELTRSTLDYGVPDVAGANFASQDRRNAFMESLAGVIRNNDPRFQSVKVVPLENTDPLDRTLRFRIEATIRVEAGPETTVFDFQLEPVSRHFE